MSKFKKLFIHLVVLSLMSFSSLYAQTVTKTPAVDTNVVKQSAAAASQAPDDTLKKLSALVHAGKYPEAGQFVTGLLVIYPADQRLIRAQTLIAQLSAPPITGVDKIEYNALIQQAQEAQQTTDLDQQKTLLTRFMDESSAFLQKHPAEMLLWELRLAAAISLDNPMDAYTAGQKLLDAGGADSNDPKLQSLLAQLKNKGWLDKQGAEAEIQRREDARRDAEAARVRADQDRAQAQQQADQAAAEAKEKQSTNTLLWIAGIALAGLLAYHYYYYH